MERTRLKPMLGKRLFSVLSYSLNSWESFVTTFIFETIIHSIEK